MKFKRFIPIISFTALAAIAVLLGACNNSKSYAEYLTDERKAVNEFLATQRVVKDIPADSVFEVGENAPFYRLTEYGDVYMQVLNAGDKKNKAADDQVVYFRFMRMNLIKWTQTGSATAVEGNSVDVDTPAYFHFNNFTLQSSIGWGQGLQMPLKFLGMDCEVNLIIKSQYGPASEISNVQPYLYMNVRYFKSQI